VRARRRGPYLGDEHLDGGGIDADVKGRPDCTDFDAVSFDDERAGGVLGDRGVGFAGQVARAVRRE